MSQSSIYRILVGLDMSSMDEHVLSFLSQNYDALTTEKIYFIHVVEELDPVPDKKEEDRGGDIGDVSEKLKNNIENTFPKADFDYDIRLISGDPEKEIRAWSSARGVDLIVLGHKRTHDHEVEAKKLVEKPGCSLLLVPEKKSYKINKICVAIDFSELSHYILRQAETIAKNIGAEVIGLHSYQVPSGYHYSGKDHKEFAKVMEENARKDAEEFLKASELSHIKMEYVYDEKEEPAKCITQFVQENQIDLLLMGSEGRTGAASFLIGSVAKEITQRIQDIPLMIIKEKNENMDILDALKKV